MRVKKSSKSAAHEVNVDALKSETNNQRRASFRRILIKICTKCKAPIGDIGGIAYVTTGSNWYCSICYRGMVR